MTALSPRMLQTIETETAYSNCIDLFLYLDFDKHGGCVDVGFAEMWLRVK